MLRRLLALVTGSKVVQLVLGGLLAFLGVWAVLARERAKGREQARQAQRDQSLEDLETAGEIQDRIEKQTPETTKERNKRWSPDAPR
jgi:flagellar biosynthesis/type III secretory pathway M-ring protein FliF/YscJ